MRLKKYPVKLICSSLNLARSTLYYKSRKEINKEDKENNRKNGKNRNNGKNKNNLNSLTETELIEKIREIAYRYPFYGYRRIYKTLRKEIKDKNLAPVNIKRVYRLYKELSLVRPKKPRRKNRIKEKENNKILDKPLYPSHIWAMDFSFTNTEKGRAKILSIEDLYSRKLLHIEVGSSITSYEVQDTLKHLFTIYNKPKIIKTDNGPEFRSYVLSTFLQKERVYHKFIPPGKPFYNGHKERSIRTIKEECIWMNEFYDLKELRDTLEKYKDFYNKERPHSSLGDKVPDEVFYGKEVKILDNVGV